ncbi:MAG: tetratricopeptide repeat protein [Acidobacteriota bacterium]
MRKRALFAGVAVCVLGCAPRSRQVGRPIPPASGVAVTFQRQVINAVDAGEGDLVVRTLRERMAAEPGNLQVRLELARRYRESGFPEIALEHCRLAAARFPDSAEVQTELARSLRGLGLSAEAAQGLEEFLGSHPRSWPQASAWLGILRDELGQWREGEAAHRAALALAPDLDYLHNNLGYNLLQQGRVAEAETEFRRALALRPDSKVARNNLGMAMAARREQALGELRAAGDPATAHNNLACALIEQGRYAEARKELDLALGYTRNHPAALRNLSLLAELDGQPVAAPLKPHRPGGWSRFWSAVWRVVAGIEDNERTDAAKAAS